MKRAYAVITGASSGIGEEFARKLSSCGYRLILVARRRERLAALAEELRAQGTECEVFPADLSKKEECYRLAESLEDKQVSVFINSAGFGDCGSFLDTDLDRELDMLNVNVRAVHLLTKLILKKMQAQHGGYLLNVASCAGLIPAGPYMAAYYATKAYVTSLTRAVAQELADKKSPVYLGVLCPGPVNTEFNEVANVKFALSGISAKRCVHFAIRGMKRRQTVIIPTLAVRALSIFGRFLPQSFYIRLAGQQQQRKLGGGKNGKPHKFEKRCGISSLEAKSPQPR